MESAYKGLFGDKRLECKSAIEGSKFAGPDPKLARENRPLTDKWTFSTNGVSIMGRNGIPCIGFGPGAESQAHAPNEITWAQDLVTCAAVYAALPSCYEVNK